MKYKIVLHPGKQFVYDDLSKAVTCFYKRITELSNEFIDFYEDNRLLITWVRGKGIIEKKRNQQELLIESRVKEFHFFVRKS